MKTFKKFAALVVAMLVVLAMSASAFAASITINQDSTYEGTDGEAGREYKYYKVFSASYGSDFTQDFEGGYDDDGNAVTEQGDGNVSYTATATVGEKLQGTGNLWFDAVAIPGSASGEYVVTWKDGVAVDADTVQAAAAWLIENGAYEDGPTALSFADGKWTSGDIDAGYYIISSDTGDNLAAVTTDIEINEKNAYPPINKEQADEDAETATEDTLDVAIGDVLTYTATVSIPKTAKTGDKMVVTDTPSKGLTYNNNVTVAANGATVDLTTPAPTGDQAWAATITVTDECKGKDVVFTYTMTVNSDALVDTGKINTFDLKYGDKYTSIPETVEYKTYFSGIEKIDGEDSTIKLAGVEFTLKEGDAEFPVTKAEDGYYYYDAAGSSTVVTDEDGLIIIRGLDNDKVYTLTETANPNPGYNMLSGPATLQLVEDKGDAYATATFEQIENNKGTVLPSTGGMGTTILYTVGGILVLGAAIIMITRRRVRG